MLETRRKEKNNQNVFLHSEEAFLELKGTSYKSETNPYLFLVIFNYMRTLICYQ